MQGASPLVNGQLVSLPGPKGQLSDYASAVGIAPEGTYSYEHDAAGRNRLLVFPDGHQREQAFDAQGRITSRCYRYPGQPALDRCYTSEYDATGNPVRMVDPEGEDLLTVDALDRLTSVTRRVAGQADVVEPLSFNALGALGSHAGSTVSTARPRLTGGGTAPSAIPASIDGRDVSIDGLGQVVGIGPETLSWTRSGQLTGIVRAADEERHSYDAYQRRIARARGPVGGPFASVYYTYEGPNIAQEVTISPNALLRSWIYDGVDHPLRMRDARPGATTPLAYYELDLAGNVRRLRAPGGADLGGYRYAAFGKQLAADATTPAPTIDQPMRWKGRWWSEFGGAAGTYDMRARIWSPELGVFLSIDEFTYHDASSTLWGWPAQSPVRYADPTGRCPLCVVVAVIAVGSIFGLSADSGPLAKENLGQPFIGGLAGAVGGLALSAELPGLAAMAHQLWRWLIGGGGAAVTQKAGSCSGRAQSSGIDPNKLHHIFENESHELEPLVERLGGQEPAFRAIQRAGQTAAEQTGTANGGLFDGRVMIEGTSVRIWGRMMDGVFRVSSASARPDP